MRPSILSYTDITPRFAGILMAFTNCTANLAGLLAPIVAGNLIDGKVRHRFSKPIVAIQQASSFNDLLFLCFFSRRWRSGKSCFSSQPVFTLDAQHFTISSVRPSDRNGIIQWMMRRSPFQSIKSMAMVYKRTAAYKQMAFNGHQMHRYWATDKRN